MSSQYLKKPLLTKKIEYKSLNGFAYASCQMQGTFLFNSGWRKSMEDSIIFKQIADGVYIFGVFDGHGGPEVARYVADNLPIFLKEDSFFKSKNYTKALNSVFRKIDEALQSIKGEEELVIICKRLGVTHPQKQKISYRSGTTANVLLMTKDKLYLANIGDSRAILCHNNKAITLSNDHKPDLPQEKLRIQKAGGYVSMGRVNGTLSLSRSFGDFDHKHFSNRPYQEQAVISVPEIIQINRSYGDNFILMGCDGVWQKYVSDSDKMIKHITQIKQKTKGLPSIMQNLFNDLVAKDIKQRLGCDNMSAILIELY